ncbi:esterase-like activity of phytase family protein [Moraxella sp. FZLJ2107]|uniref:esterase-like activity of phytase family protein n=1 Tax=unclassified Moraxella TaxID=2685852 RepID=UPI0020C8A1DC|nr:MULTISPECIES: esterase-like activity of phytase family protein [unclassified Moraxella]UTO06192.1 esterase-like activity of phytase family protein [Moraxella sp. FZLJ2107]UTO23469.1 esterase-like activity of phytase family protein [Moraxella sp. FZLJ2109]
MAGCLAIPAMATTPKATLTGFAKLGVETYADGPMSGSAVKAANGITPPFKAQPVQGFSGALKNNDGSYTVLADNGFGAKDNSADFLLRLYQVAVDFRTQAGGTGEVKVLNYVQLKDPNRLIPFEIVNQNSPDRLLTGADFDPESIQRDADGGYWIGEEFGPFLLHFDKDGVLIDAPIALSSPYQTGEYLRSPQNPLNTQSSSALVQRSGGFEGMAKSADGKFLYPVLEKPLTNATGKQLLIFQFDLDKKAYTGNYYLFNLDEKATAIGDFQMIDNRSGILIERDDSENKLDGYKKLIRITLGSSGQTVARTELVNLMDIHNPHRLYEPVRAGDIGAGKQFAFPFFTIEDVIIEDATTLTVLNDNNFPSSSGRNANLADDNEVIQLKLNQPMY